MMRLMYSTALLALLAACGGGGGGALDPMDGPPDTQTPDPLPVVPNSQQLVGAHLLRTTGNDGASRLDATVGQIIDATGKLTLTDGDFAFSDNDGFDALGVADGGPGNSLILADLGAGLSDVSVYSGTFIDDGTLNIVSIAVFGNAVNDAFAPSGAATYTGQAEVNIVIDGVQSFLNDGTATLSVNFDTSRADLTLSDFNSLQVTAIDEVRVTDMEVRDDRFGGDDLKLYLNGSVVNPLGTLDVASGTGILAGENGDQTAGIIAASGADGAIYGAFVGQD